MFFINFIISCLLSSQIISDNLNKNKHLGQIFNFAKNFTISEQ